MSVINAVARGDKGVVNFNRGLNVKSAFQKQPKGIRCMLWSTVGKRRLLIVVDSICDAERSDRLENTTPITRFNVGALCE